MNQYEVPALLADELPDLRYSIKMVGPLGNIHLYMRLLADYADSMATIHRLDKVKQCMRLAERIYVRGNQLIRNAVENVFVFSITHIMYACTSRERQTIQAQMPVTLHSLYMQQLLKSGL